MQSNEMKDAALSSLLDGLISQNLALGQRQLALQALCSTLLVELCLMDRDPAGKAMRLSAELGGMAALIARDAEANFDPALYQTVEITQVIDSVTRVAEETVQCKSRTPLLREGELVAQIYPVFDTADRAGE